MSEWLQVAMALGVVTLYYLAVWALWGRDPAAGTLVTQYEPPRGMSPALIRYCWKQRFDERVVWSALMNLVARGLAVLETRDGETVIKPASLMKTKPALSSEEAPLYSELATAKGREGLRLSLADDWMEITTCRMADALKRCEQSHWFRENRNTVLGGAILSAVVLLFTVKPTKADDIFALLIAAAVIAFSVYYLYFIVQRMVELARAMKKHLGRPVAGRQMQMSMMAVSCVTGIVLGSVVLYANFGWRGLGTLGGLSVINLLFLHLMKAPTRQGRKLLDDIEGFRHFLQMVEQMPMDSAQAPGDKRGLYEKYLPYALALEVEQQWCDQMSALGSSAHQFETVVPINSYYLGMWNGKPVEVAFRLD